MGEADAEGELGGDEGPLLEHAVGRDEAGAAHRPQRLRQADGDSSGAGSQHSPDLGGGAGIPISLLFDIAQTRSLASLD